MTGDDNVPRGEISWTAQLPERSSRDREGEEVPVLPTVKAADWLRWCELPDRARWDEGTVEAKGRSKSQILHIHLFAN
jgi:hypothetical protein